MSRPAHMPVPMATADQLREACEELLAAHDPVIRALRSQGRHDEARELTREKDHLFRRLAVLCEATR